MKAMKTKIRASDSVFKTVVFLVLALYTLLMVVLIVWGLFSALKTVDEFRTNSLWLPYGWPWEWSWNNFVSVFMNFEVPIYPNGIPATAYFENMLLNTVLYVVVGAFLLAFVPCIMAYVTAKFPNFFSSIITGIVIVTMIIPIVGSYPSEVQILKTLGLYDSYFGMWIQKANFLGIYYLVFFAAFKALPKDMEEAASIDGASEWTIMFRITLPLVRNVFFTVMLIKFIELWNDYQTPLLYFPSLPTLSYGLFHLANSRVNSLSNVPMRMASCIIVLMPILVLFLCFSNRIIGNVTMGAIKE